MLTGVIGVSLALIISACFNAFLLASRNRAEVRYIDRSGISQNPPTFLETWQNKTINLKYGGLKIIIPHLPIRENLTVISQIAGNFQIYEQGAKAFFKLPLGDKQRSDIYEAAYSRNIKLLYKLAKPHSKGLFFKRRFHNLAAQDSEFIFRLSEAVFDYWQYMGKLSGALAKGQTPRLMYGADLFSDSLKWDSHGNRSITPRFEDTFQSLSKKQLKTRTLGGKQIDNGTALEVIGGPN